MRVVVISAFGERRIGVWGDIDRILVFSGLVKTKYSSAAQAFHKLLEARRLWLLVSVLRLWIHVRLGRHPLGQVV